jgi:hypothetical protein
MKNCNETPEDIVLAMHQSIDWELEDRPVTRHSSLNTVPDIDKEFDAGYGSQEGDSIIVYTKDFIYMKHVYDGAEGFVSIAQTPRKAIETYLTYVPVMGS